MSRNLRFDGRVAIVTGAGGGLGKAYALLLASKGASVVVNDLGGATTGGGGSTRPADGVVQEIRRQGGQAVSSYDSVEEGDKIVKTAIDNYGRIDILINNAGIVRDRSFLKMAEEDWDLVYRVHLRGSFVVTKAAWLYMKQQNYGRIIMTSSTSGLYGNFGQANYSAAKMGLVGLSNTLAIEGEKYGIHCNAVMPFAASRLSQNVMPEDIAKTAKPEYVAPVVAYLCHEDCSETGAMLEIGGGWASRIRLQQADGVALREGDKAPSIETVRDKWDKITDFEKSFNRSTSAEAIGHMMNKTKQVKSSSHKLSSVENSKPSSTRGSSSSPFAGVDLAKLKAQQFGRKPFTYTEKDIMLYALGVGVKAADPSSLKFIYEHHPVFSALPTYGVITSWSGFYDVFGAGLQNVPLDLTKFLHGEQYLEITKPIPTSGTLYCETKIVDILDKQSGASLVIEMTTTDAQNEQVCFNQFIGFFVGAGKFGGPRSSPHVKKILVPPNRDPDAVVEETTSEELAAVYRLSGDYNPLHIDPEIAALGGFDRPILHGMSTFGHSARHVLSKFADNDVTKFKAIKGRFSNPVLPGQTLRTEMWKEGNRILYRTLVVETGTVAVSGGYVDLIDTLSRESVSGGQTDSDVVFEQIRQRTARNPSLLQKVNAIFSFHITQDGHTVKQWTIDLKNKPGSVTEGPSAVTPDCTLTISDSNFIEMATGKLTGQQAFMNGKLKIAGNVMLAQKLQALFKDQAKL